MDSCLTFDMPEVERFLSKDKVAAALLLGFSFTDALYRHNAPSDVQLF
jgi:hypothetical protein